MAPYARISGQSLERNLHGHMYNRATALYSTLLQVASEHHYHHHYHSVISTEICHIHAGLLPLPLDGTPVAEGEGLRSAEEDRRPHAGDTDRLLPLLLKAGAVAVAVAVVAAGEGRPLGQGRPGGEEAAGQRALRVQPLDGVPSLPDRHLKNSVERAHNQRKCSATKPRTELPVRMDTISMRVTSIRMMPEEEAGGSVSSAATAALSCPTASCGAGAAGRARVSRRLTAPRSPAPGTQPFMDREHDGRIHLPTYVRNSTYVKKDTIGSSAHGLTKGSKCCIRILPSSSTSGRTGGGGRRSTATTMTSTAFGAYSRDVAAAVRARREVWRVRGGGKTSSK